MAPLDTPRPSRSASRPHIALQTERAEQYYASGAAQRRDAL
ncbi:hypothetical protein [Gordonia tangerina]|nr:hypothetical protein [Gordonia tangerina]